VPDSTPRPDPTGRRARATLPSPFACSWTTVGDADAAWMHLAGELDIATTPRLEFTLSEAHAQSRLVVLDLRELEFMDAAGTVAIVRATHRARRIGRQLRLVRTSPVIERVFALTGTAGDVVDGHVGAAEAPRRALARLAAEGGAS
jgi:anti-sigma B factor antagonist